MGSKCIRGGKCSDGCTSGFVTPSLRQPVTVPMNWLLEGITYVLSTVGALLPIVNPLSAVGLVVTITANLTEAERAEQIKRACIYMFCILTAFLVAGGLIMNFFGISIPGLRIAGGMIVSYLGFRMLFPDTGSVRWGRRGQM